MRPSVLPGAAVVLALALCASPTLALGQSFTLSGDRVAIYDLVGKISIGPGTGSSVEVEVTRTGADGNQLRVENGPVAGRSTLRVIFPGDRIVVPSRGEWDGSTELTVRDDGTFGGDWRDHDGGRGHRVTIRSHGEGLEAAANLTVRIPAGHRVAVYVGAGLIEAANVNGALDLDAASGNLSVRGHHGALTLDTGSGDVTVDGVDGDLSIDTGSGDVHVTATRNGDVEIDTGSGDVTGGDLQATRLKVETGSGNINLSRAGSADVALETGSGDVELALLTDIEAMSVETGSGEVTLTIPEGLGADIRIETSSGDIDSDVPITVRRRSSDTLVGTIGDGRGHLTVETGSGDVKIRK